MFDDLPDASEIDFDFNDLGPGHLNIEALRENLGEYGQMVRTLPYTDAQVVAVVVATMVGSFVMVGGFSTAQIGNWISRALIEEGGFHRVQYC